MLEDGREYVQEWCIVVFIEKLGAAPRQLPSTVGQAVRARLLQKVANGGFRSNMMIERARIRVIFDVNDFPELWSYQVLLLGKIGVRRRGVGFLSRRSCTHSLKVI